MFIFCSQLPLNTVFLAIDRSVFESDNLVKPMNVSVLFFDRLCCLMSLSAPRNQTVYVFTYSAQAII